MSALLGIILKLISEINTFINQAPGIIMELIKALFSSFGIFNSTLTSKFALINVNGGIFKTPQAGVLKYHHHTALRFLLAHFALNAMNTHLFSFKSKNYIYHLNLGTFLLFLSLSLCIYSDVSIPKGFILFLLLTDHRPCKM